jgi:ABC-type dipeptide/oligopeptide/nickel transport system permease component
VPLSATIERVQARALAEVAGAPSLVSARARGLSTAHVWWRHAWRLALPPVASACGTLAGAVLSGALAVEVITAWPGLGRLTYDALFARDAPLVAGCALATAVLVSAGALAADLVVAWADPRARHQA